MIVRLDITPTPFDLWDYRVSHEAELIFDDEGLNSLIDAIVAAVEGLSPEVIGVELALDGVVSGTYPLELIGLNIAQIAQHAQNTTDAIREAGAR